MDRICMIVDFDGFQFSRRPFLVRELGYVSMASDDCGVASFDLSGVPVDGNKDLDTIRYCRKFVHGLPFHPRLYEHSHPLEYLDDFLLELYDRYRTPSRDWVAYKGGSCERLKLQELDVPSVNLEVFGCPKYDVLRQMYADDVCQEVDCNLHDRCYGGRMFHCALAEVKTFKRWVEDRLQRENERKLGREDEREGWTRVIGRRRRNKRKDEIGRAHV